MKLSGVFAPIPTPIDDHDRVDTHRLRAALDKWIKRPLAGFVVLGSNGEAALLDEVEADRVIVAAREAIPREQTMIVGTGRESTQATIHATKRAAELGADYVLVRTPGFFKSQMTTDVFVRHYTAVADASPVPVLLYNFTAVTGVNLLPAAVARLGTHANIVGMKESGGDIAQITEVIAGTPADFQMIAGSLATFYAALCVGCVGGILAPACVVAEACVQLYELTRAARHDEAQRLQQELLPIARLLGGGGYGVAGLKAALSVIGYDVGMPRPPLVAAPDAAYAAVRDALSQLSHFNSQLSIHYEPAAR
ncbi:MAG TPA: dihydrodipicolinate synthase family protein [Vicinamibacterales bacterium]|nr:dihydrodipicolinate synthase family protein [Vicinamibacterales bacterium]